MDYPKVSQAIFDPVSENVKKLKALFPSAVKDGEVDFKILKQELGSFSEVGQEKYELNWAGKKETKEVTNKPLVGKTLKYLDGDSKNYIDTEHVFIEGDNLEALKLIRQNYYGGIKMIYIDPPYNTGSDFIYNDNFRMSADESAIAEGDMSDLGERYTVNRKNQNRYHTNWLNMMYSRLQLARDLLRDDGVIFVSIDEIEHANLRKIGEEVFGGENYIGDIVWKNSSKNDQNYISVQHEYILCFVKDKNCNNGLWKEKKEGLDVIFKAFEKFRVESGDDWSEIHKKALA